MNPSKHSLTILGQLFKLIPRNLIPKLAKKHSIDEKSRSISATSHVLTLMFGQLSHAISLNDICDCLKNHNSALSSMRDSVAPSRNGLSHANRERNADMAEDLFWSVLGVMKSRFPSFIDQGRIYSGIPYRFKRAINVVDSSTIKLVANFFDWAKYRRRKASAKMHLRLDLHFF